MAASDNDIDDPIPNEEKPDWGDDPVPPPAAASDTAQHCLTPEQAATLRKKVT